MHISISDMSRLVSSIRRARTSSAIRRILRSHGVLPRRAGAVQLTEAQWEEVLEAAPSLDLELLARILIAHPESAAYPVVIRVWDVGDLVESACASLRPTRALHLVAATWQGSPEGFTLDATSTLGRLIIRACRRVSRSHSIHSTLLEVAISMACLSDHDRAAIAAIGIEGANDSSTVGFWTREAWSYDGSVRLIGEEGETCRRADGHISQLTLTAATWKRRLSAARAISPSIARHLYLDGVHVPSGALS